MKPAIGTALIAACTALSATTLAQSGEEVAKSKGCLACHALDQTKAGPSFKDISAEHRGDARAEARLIGILKSGKGHPKAKASRRGAESDGPVSALVSQQP